MTIKRMLRDEMNWAIKKSVESTPYYTVYFVDNDDRYVKIGITNCVSNRLNHYNTSNPGTVTLMAELDMPNKHSAYLLEQSLIQRFDKYHVKGEWFKKNQSITNWAEAMNDLNKELKDKKRRETVNKIDALIRNTWCDMNSEENTCERL